MVRYIILLAAALIGALAFGRIAVSQDAQPNSATNPRSESGPTPSSSDSASSQESTQSQREEIWNSPRMLRARAWLQEYCERSATISPEEAREYMAELKQLTPIQMKLWLLKFDEEQEELDRRQAAFQQARRTSVARALDIQEATEAAHARIAGASGEAINAQQSFEARRRAAQAMYAQRAENSAEAATEMTFEGAASGYPWYRDFHYHVHSRE
ncbi:MAG TPA: hypothetical protein VF175_04600 [Lacipirellula sp.]